MATPILKLNIREAVGKNKVSKERKEGNIPGVVYSRNEETKNIYINEREMEKFLSQHGLSGRIGLNLEGEKSYAIIKDIQRSPIKNKLLHVDFQTLDEKEKIKMIIPINVINREKVEVGNKIFQMQTNEVEIQTYPRYLPENVEIDAIKLEEKDSLTLEDLNIASDENIEILDDMDRVIATIVYASVEEETTEETTDEEIEEVTEEKEDI